MARMRTNLCMVCKYENETDVSNETNIERTWDSSFTREEEHSEAALTVDLAGRTS